MEMRMSGRDLDASEQLSVSEASSTYSIPASTLYDRARRHEGLARKVFGRVLIDRRVLERLLAGLPLIHQRGLDRGGGWLG
jgi:hypothetical protein